MSSSTRGSIIGVARAINYCTSAGALRTMDDWTSSDSLKMMPDYFFVTDSGTNRQIMCYCTCENWIINMLNHHVVVTGEIINNDSRLPIFIIVERLQIFLGGQMIAEPIMRTKKGEN